MAEQQKHAGGRRRISCTEEDMGAVPGVSVHTIQPGHRLIGNECR